MLCVIILNVLAPFIALINAGVLLDDIVAYPYSRDTRGTPLYGLLQDDECRSLQ
jgi:hypothetical protein